jgi:hypothetical protein
MNEIKCLDCKNLHTKEGICTFDEEDKHIGHGLAVFQINEIWGLTFQDCKKYEVKILFNDVTINDRSGT